MGIYLHNMEMPTSCMLCSFCVEEADPANGEMCMVTGTLMPPCTRERLNNCPLVYVQPHGDLIDREALINDMANMIPWAVESPEEIAMVDGLSAGYEAVKDAPTIIQASKEVNK